MLDKKENICNASNAVGKSCLDSLAGIRVTKDKKINKCFFFKVNKDFY